MKADSAMANGSVLLRLQSARLLTTVAELRSLVLYKVY
jgi:hypothetical protein